MKTESQMERMVACMPGTNGFAFAIDAVGWAIKVPRCPFGELVAALKEDHADLPEVLNTHIGRINKAVDENDIPEDTVFDEFLPLTELMEARDLCKEVAMAHKDDKTDDGNPQLAYLSLLVASDLLNWAMDEESLVSPTFEKACAEIPEQILGASFILDPMLAGFWHCYICRTLRHYEIDAKMIYEMSKCSDEKSVGCEEVHPSDGLDVLQELKKQVEAEDGGAGPGIILPDMM